MAQDRFPKIAEPGQFPDAPFSKKTILKEGTSQTVPNRKFELTHRSEGYSVAGSMMRWDGEAWGVLFFEDNATHGRWFLTEPEARDLFQKWTGETEN